MAALVSREIIIERVAQEAQWVVNQRMEKFRQAMHDTMSVSPFLVPISSPHLFQPLLSHPRPHSKNNRQHMFVRLSRIFSCVHEDVNV